MRYVTFVAALLLLPAAAGAQQQPVVNVVPHTPSVSAVGQAEARMTPDRAHVTVAVETRAKTAAAAAAENARITRVTLDALRAQRLSAEQLRTLNYNVYPEQTWDEQNRRPQITGYVARNTIRAEVRDVARVGAVIDAALAGGATNIEGIEWWSSTMAQTRRETLGRAVTAACRDAQVLAQAAGRGLGPALDIQSMDFMQGPPQPMMMRDMAMKAEAGSVPTPINPGEQTITVSVTTRWALLPMGVSPGGRDAVQCAP